MRYLRRHAQKISSEHNLHAQFSILLQNARLWKMYSSRLPGILNSTILLYCCSVGFVFTFMFHVFYFVILIVLVPGHVISPLVYVSCSYWLIQTCVHQFYFLIGSLSCHVVMSYGYNSCNTSPPYHENELLLPLSLQNIHKHFLKNNI